MFNSSLRILWISCVVSAINFITPVRAFGLDKCSILVEKSKRILTLNSDKKIFIYPIRLGRSPVGQKEYEGDNKTPEGEYKIISKYISDKYHLGLRISYPSKEDIERSAKLGKNPGGDIFVHGQKKGVEETWAADWTRGCIALSNKDMEELHKKVTLGCKITIKK